MSFRTEIPVEAFPFSINHQSPVVLLGSCFAENIGQKLEEYKFNAIVNPFGVLFNPVSIAQSIERLVVGEVFANADLFEYQDVCHSFLHHSRFSGTNRNAVLETINTHFTRGLQQLKCAEVLIITLGTTWVYEHLALGQVVSNCHKLPARQFKKYRLSATMVANTLTTAINKVRTLNPNLKVVLTVSPVRHLSDGFAQNQLSKATLVVACHQLTEQCEGVYYFPAYEMLMDDLRDYRFYADDMVHPSQAAVNYIWEKFGQAFFLPDTLGLNGQIAKIKAAASHRPFNPKTEAHGKFVENTLQQITRLHQQFPEIDFSPEVARLTQY